MAKTYYSTEVAAKAGSSVCSLLLGELLLLLQSLDQLWRHLIQKSRKNSVRPSKSDYVLAVPDSDMGLRGPRDDIVFFSNGFVVLKVLHHHAQEAVRDSVGVGFVAVSKESFDREEMNRSPPIGIIPLRLSFPPAHGEPARLLE